MAQVAFLVHYFGRVQGVGFRATAVHVARGHPVTGWVKNLPDGRVALWVEGEEADVQAFLRDIHDRWTSCLDGEDCQPQQPTGRYPSFAVTR